MCNRPLISIAAVVVASSVWCLSARADEPADAAQNNDEHRGLKIDIGRFTPHARGIVIEVVKNDDGKPTVQVQVDKASAGGTGVKVDVVRDGDGKPSVKVDLQRDVFQEIRVGVGDGPVEAKRPEAPREMENYLGIFTRPIPESTLAQLGSLIGENRGLLVLSVQPESAAATAGVKKFDILVKYNEHDVTSVEQLKKLIAADKPGRTVKLEIIRAGEKKNIEAVLAQRPVENREAGDVNASVESNRDRQVVIHRLGIRPIIINKRLIQVPGVTIRLDRNQEGATESKVEKEEITDAHDKGVKQESNRKLLVTTLDGKRFKIELAYTAADGAKIERTLEGTPKEIEEKTKGLPEEIRADVRRSVKDFSDPADKKQSRAFRFHIEPRVEGDRPVMRLSMRRMAEDGETRILEVQQVVKGRRAVDVADLMKIDVVAAEIQGLGPAIREKVEATLNRVEIPQVRVDVEKSQ